MLGLTLLIFLAITIALIILFLWKKDETKKFVKSHLLVKD